MTTRVSGLLLFLPVPLVLWLYTRQPLGVPLSLAVGTALVVTHRLYARPFALRRASVRCLWCGGIAGDGLVLELSEPLGASTWRACSPAHHERLRRVFDWASSHAPFLKILILGGVALFLPAALLASRGRLGPLVVDDVVAFFRLAIAVAVLPLGWLSLLRAPTSSEPLRVPFPVHIQALIGTLWVLWLFRLVGIWWLILGMRHVLERYS
jgi:hypothetical protein